MTRSTKRGISREGLDAAFEADEARKSRLILEGRSLSEQGQDELAAGKFAEAAEIEYHLARICREKGLTEKSLVHLFSAASCWASAGNYYDAIVLCNELLAQAGLPDRLRQRVQDYSESLLQRRAEMSARIAADLASREARSA